MRKGFFILLVVCASFLLFGCSAQKQAAVPEANISTQNNSAGTAFSQPNLSKGNGSGVDLNSNNTGGLNSSVISGSISEQVSACSRQNSTYLADECIIELAKKTNDSSLCNSSALQNKPLCYTELAKLRKDYELCSKVENRFDAGEFDPQDWLTQDRCRMFVALEKGDTGFCDKEFFSKLDQGNSDECFTIFAEGLNNTSWCRKVYGNDNTGDCYARVARATENKALCEEIDSSASSKAECYAFIGFDTNDFTVCDNLSLRDNMQMQCLEYLPGLYAFSAQQNNNFSICDLMPESRSFRDTCYYKLAPNVKDASLCSKIASEETRNLCEKAVSEQIAASNP